MLKERVLFCLSLIMIFSGICLYIVLVLWNCLFAIYSYTALSRLEHD